MPPAAQARFVPNEAKRDSSASPVFILLLIAAALAALGSVLLAALPMGTLERMLAVEAHYRAEEIVNFVDGHRVDIAVAGIATLLVTAVVIIPTVAG
jgi:carbon starvation protein CstA